MAQKKPKNKNDTENKPVQHNSHRLVTPKQRQLLDVTKKINNGECRNGNDIIPDDFSETNATIIEHGLRLFQLPDLPTLSNLDEVNNRIAEYFRICREDNMKPSAPGLGMVLGFDRKEIIGLVSENPTYKYLWERRKVSQESFSSIKKAYKYLSILMEDYTQAGKINPVPAIFLMKNNFGYRDEQEVVVKPDNQLGDANADAAQKLLNSIPAESDEET